MPGIFAIARPASRETRVNASEPGSYQLAVEIRNSDGILLGRGTGQINVVPQQAGGGGRKTRTPPP